MPGGSTGTGGTSSNDSSPPLPTQFEATDNWVVYNSRIEQYFVAYNITDDNRKRAILLTSLSQEVYTRLMDLCFPDLPETKSFKEIGEILKETYKPVVTVYIERRKFYEAEQNEGESVANFLARLRGLTRHCKFGNSFNDVLRDKFVCGLSKGPLFNKAIEMEPTANLEACVEAVLKKEATLSQDPSSLTASMHYIQRNSKSCEVCGDIKHKSKVCKFKTYVCRVCNVKGHLAKVCSKNGPDKKKAQANYHLEMDDNSNSEDDEGLTSGLYHMNLA